MSEKNYQRKRTPAQIFPSGDSLTRPEFLSQSSILSIIRRGIQPPTTPQIFNDNFSIGDKIDNFHKVQNAIAAFESLPAESRKVFDFNPSKLISAVETSNFDLLKRAGLTKPDPTPPQSKDNLKETLS